MDFSNKADAFYYLVDLTKRLNAGGHVDAAAVILEPLAGAGAATSGEHCGIVILALKSFLLKHSDLAESDDVEKLKGAIRAYAKAIHLILDPPVV